ncbi:MAG: alcohol dehydrogenase catalytic domain-containing protein [Caldilineaceae bacterium]
MLLLRMAASGVCHSDLSVVTGTIYYDPPVVLGHEGAGIVEEVEPGVTAARAAGRSRGAGLCHFVWRMPHVQNGLRGALHRHQSAHGPAAGRHLPLSQRRR